MRDASDPIGAIYAWPRTGQDEQCLGLGLDGEVEVDAALPAFVLGFRAPALGHRPGLVFISCGRSNLVDHVGTLNTGADRLVLPGGRGPVEVPDLSLAELAPRGLQALSPSEKQKLFQTLASPAMSAEVVRKLRFCAKSSLLEANRLP